jgi:hypothetical protein
MNDLEYSTKVVRLHTWGADLFRAPADDSAILAAGSRYYVRGQQEGFTVGELVDFLGVSSPSVLSRAGWGDDDVVRIMQLLSDKLAEPGASPNGGPAGPFGNSGAGDGPPSVS